MPSGQMAELPADSVTDYCRADATADLEADPGRLSYRAYQQVPGNQGLTGAAAAANGGNKLRPAPQPGGCGKHRQSPLVPSAVRR
jgi:hypothetical protein